MNRLYVHRFKSKIGWIHLAETEKGIAIVDFPSEKSTHFDLLVKKEFEGYEILKGGKENKRAEGQLKSYFEGKLKRFSLRLDFRGTAFQNQALKQVAKIPFGRVTTYGAIAAAIGKPSAARAVGSANARNHLPIIVPCHRVIACNGLGGYGGGLKMKQYLLKIEGVKT